MTKKVLKTTTSQIFYNFELGIGGFVLQQVRIVWKVSSGVHLLEFGGAIGAPLKGISCMSFQA